jgi:PleD family two-component response regulator
MFATSVQEPAGTAAVDTLQEGYARRVLLIEDDADQRRLIAWMLRGEGCDVVEADS